MKNGQACSKENILRYLCDEEWSNDACCGYVLIACKALGYTDEQKRNLISAINDAFGNYTVDEAKQKHIKNEV